MTKSSKEGNAARQAELQRFQDELAGLSSDYEDEDGNSGTSRDDGDEDDDSPLSFSSSDASSAIEITPPPPPKKEIKTKKEDISETSYKSVDVGSTAVETANVGREQSEYPTSRKLSARGIAKELGKRIRFRSKNRCPESLACATLKTGHCLEYCL